VRHAFQAERRAAVVLQERRRAVVAGRVERHAFLEQRKAALRLQRAWREVLHTRTERAHTAAQMAAARILQARWRALQQGRAARAELAAMAVAATKVQAAVRGFLARQRYASARAQVVLLQSVWRGWRYVSREPPYIPEYAWTDRGEGGRMVVHRVRRASPPAVAAACARVRAANARFSEAMTLGSRTRAALAILLSSRVISDVRKACYHLGTWTL
jgi:hypothetical protein